MKFKDYPKILVENRASIEFSFIFSLWKQPDIVDDYRNVVNGVDIITEDGIFYYGILNALHKLGYAAFDNVAVLTFLQTKPELKKGFDMRGGFSSINDMLEVANENNLPVHYDELMKSNMILRLYERGFNVEKDFKKLTQMTSSQVYDYYDFLLNDVRTNKVEKIQAKNLSEGYDSFIESWNQGVSVGYKVGAPLLNYTLAGVHKKNLLLHLGHIGNGKTTTAILLYILPVIENGENICILANEQDEDEWRQMILASVVFNKIEGSWSCGLTRQKMITGHFTDEQTAYLYAAKEWLEKAPGKIEFISFSDYSVNNVKKIIKKYSKLGFGLFVFDTMKPEQENSDKAWADFSEVAKELFMTAKKEDVAVIATAQLSSDSMARSYLDLSCIGKSRAIAETATQVTMFRNLTDAEKDKLKPFNFVRDENGKTTGVKQLVNLDKDKEYIVMFIPKNRFGSTTRQIVYERNMSFNTMREIGWINIPYDIGPNRK